jgi:hypothetical protein
VRKLPHCKEDHEGEDQSEERGNRRHHRRDVIIVFVVVSVLLTIFFGLVLFGALSLGHAPVLHAVKRTATHIWAQQEA